MKRAVCAAVLAGALGLAASGPPSREAEAAPGAGAGGGIPVQVDVFRGYYARGALRQATYHVRVRVTNRKPTPVDFDEAVAEFVPADGKGTPLRVSTTTEVRPYYWGLSPGKTRVFEFDTNGYTDSLLADAGEAGLLFALTLRLNGKTVVPPRPLKLPDLKAVPPDKKGKSTVL